DRTPGQSGTETGEDHVAAVYVQPGAKVAVHLEKPLAIDFDPEGRKVDHRAGESHALELE
ncbi:hypothetical protein JTM24_35370, partial [Pseudomonas aeruginosa]|nr:hypothetical protein [Pseudomonas aeruginosa]